MSGWQKGSAPEIESESSNTKEHQLFFFQRKRNKRLDLDNN
jgi:hypothetical protein